MKLVLENVRCFAGRHDIPIRPLTILVGENSSGKSTTLAMLSAALTKVAFQFRPDLNQPPYDLGNFRNIVNLGRKRISPEASFTIGLEFSEDDNQELLQAESRFVDSGGQPTLDTLCLQTKAGTLTISVNNDKLQYRFENKDGRESKVGYRSFADHVTSPAQYVAYSLISYEDRDQGMWFMRNFVQPIRSFLDGPPLSLSIAPVRTKPERTYDAPRSGFLPQGEHIPFALAKLLESGSGSKRQERAVETIQRFGQESGLYDSVEAKRLGKHPGDPFQLIVSAAGARTNLTDVGYGVSQCLPIIVESVMAKKHDWILTQQPEVHLHPRAQAALGTFFCDLVSRDSKRFVVETHSDFIVDRVRQEVAKGKLPAEKAIILYAEKHKGKTCIHPIEIDSDGNLMGAPDSYREFFLNEEFSLLSRI